MENFVKTSFELVNGNVVAGTKLMARSLVLLNDNGAMWNIIAKVRNTDKFSVVVIGKDGKIAYTELVPEITQEPDYDKALAAVK